MLYTMNKWKRMILICLWPYAMRHANDVANTTPRKGEDLLPLEKFSGVPIKPKLCHFHAFGCPTYVLDNALQSGQGAPKWKHRSRLGVYLGPSPSHTQLVALVLNPHTGHISLQIKFLQSLRDGELKELILYNKLCDLITEQMVPKAEGYGEMHTFKSILDHQGPLKHHNPKYKGSQWNILVDWDDSTQTWEPLSIIGKCDEITWLNTPKTMISFPNRVGNSFIRQQNDNSF